MNDGPVVDHEETQEDATPKRKFRFRRRPTETLPTNRIKISKQLDILRAYAASSGPNLKPVTNEDVASIVGMNESTVSLANAFFNKMGFLEKGSGGYIPCEEVREFNRAHDWGPETAGHKLAPRIKDAWFAEAIIPKLSFSPMSEKAVLGAFADACSAEQDYEPQLKVLLDYMEVAGIVTRDGEEVHLVKRGSKTEPATPAKEHAKERAGLIPPLPHTQSGAEGAVNFNVSMRVSMSEIAGWEPDRISAFFAGIAQVLAAKGGNEKEEQ